MSYRDKWQSEVRIQRKWPNEILQTEDRNTHNTVKARGLSIVWTSYIPGILYPRTTLSLKHQDDYSYTYVLAHKVLEFLNKTITIYLYS